MNARHVERILVPVTLAEGSRAAVSFAVRIAQAYRSEILLFHAVQPNDAAAERGILHACLLPQSCRAAEPELAQLASMFSAAQVAIQCRVAEGNAGQLIVENARLFAADLIVMTACHYR